MSRFVAAMSGCNWGLRNIRIKRSWGVQPRLDSSDLGFTVAQRFDPVLILPFTCYPLLEMSWAFLWDFFWQIERVRHQTRLKFISILCLYGRPFLYIYIYLYIVNEIMSAFQLHRNWVQGSAISFANSWWALRAAWCWHCMGDLAT